MSEAGGDARRTLVSARGVHVVTGRVPGIGSGFDAEDAAQLLGTDAATLGSLDETRVASYLTARRWVRDIVTVRLILLPHADPGPFQRVPFLRDGRAACQRHQ